MAPPQKEHSQAVYIIRKNPTHWLVKPVAVDAAVDATAAIEKATAAFGVKAEAPFEAAVTKQFETVSASNNAPTSIETKLSVEDARVRRSATLEQSPNT